MELIELKRFCFFVKKTLNLRYEEFELLQLSFDNVELEILKILNKSFKSKYNNIFTISEIFQILEVLYENLSIKVFLAKKIEKIIFEKEYQLNLMLLLNEDNFENLDEELKNSLNIENEDFTNEKKVILSENISEVEDKNDKYIIENKLNKYNFLLNSSQIPCLTPESEHFLMFDFISGGSIVSPDRDSGFTKAYIQTNYIAFNYTHYIENGFNRHFIEGIELGFKVEVYGYPQFFLFYDRIGFRRNLVVQIVKMKKVGLLTKPQASEIRSHRKNKSDDFDRVGNNDRKRRDEKERDNLEIEDDNSFKGLPEVKDIDWNEEV